MPEGCSACISVFKTASIMSDVSCFWRDTDLQDATLLLSSDTVLLEQTRITLQTLHNNFKADHEDICTCISNPKRRRIDSDVGPDVQTNSHQLTTQADAIPSSAASEQKDQAAPAAFSSHVQIIPVHRIVLSSGSAYFKTAICTLIGERASAPAATSSPTAGPTAPTKGLSKLLHPILVVHEEDVDAAEGVLKFMYTKTIDSKFSTAPHLMQVLLIADRWVVPGCVTACCKALAALPSASLSMDDALAIYTPKHGLLPPSLMESPDFKPVLELALSKVLQLFGDVPTVVDSCTLTAQLLQLPRIALLALLSSDLLTTDCEDSVLMLLSWWLEAQECDKDTAEGCDGKEEPEEEQAEVHELMGAIRYSRLSSTYLSQAWLLLPRLKPSDRQLMELLHLRSLTPIYSKLQCQSDEQIGCISPAGWLKPQRPLSPSRSTPTILLTLAISAAQLEEHLVSVKAMKEGGPQPEPLVVTRDFRGLSIHLMFESETWGDGDCGVQKVLCVFVGVRARLPRCDSMALLSYGVPGKHTIKVLSNIPGKPFFSRNSGSYLNQIGSGQWNFVQVMSKLPGDPLLLSWWDPFLLDGHIRLQAEFKDERSN